MERFKGNLNLNLDARVLKHLLSQTALPRSASGDYQATSVFLLLFRPGDPQILAIQKADTEGYPWRNQIALPGGHVDPQDRNSLAAVYRELKEEVDIDAEQVGLIGSMGHFQTINQKEIEVFIGWWDGSGPICFDTGEIARVLDISLSELITTHIEGGFHGRRPDVHRLRYPVDGAEVWGATAKMLHFFIEMLAPLWWQPDFGN